MRRIVWIISEGSPGHVSQSVGLASALAGASLVQVERFECRPRLNGAARSLVRAWMGKAGRPLPDWVLRRWLRLDAPASTATKPDLILSSGGKSVFAARSLAARYEVPYVFIGERKPYRSEWFHTAFTPSANENGVNDVLIEMIPTRMTRESAERAAVEWTDRPAGRLWAAVIGGASASHRYTEADWTALGGALGALAQRHGIRWLVTTSPRTGANAEKILRSAIPEEAVAYSIWWATRPEKRLAALLGAAEVVIATQDSVTMATESVASGRPTVLVRPAETPFPKGSFLPAYFERLEKTGRVLRREIAGLEQIEPADLSALRPPTEPMERSLAATLRARLGWA